MPIEIRGIPADARLRAYVTRRMNAVLRRLALSPWRAEVLFSDENGPKGGIDTRCALTVRVPYRPAVRVEHMGETPRLAFDGGFATLDRQLERYVERDRERRRYPKKYFVAKRLLQPAPGAAERARSSRRRTQGG